MPANSQPPFSHYREGLAVVWRSLWVNIALAAIKMGVGLVARSQALVADGLHSLADLAGDIAALLGLKIAEKPGDEDHPYGHHKFASLACLFVAVMLLGFCALLIWNSVHNLQEHGDEVPGAAALWVALVAMVVKEFFYRYASREARRLKLRVLNANALDHRADALASLLAVGAIGAARLGGPSWAFMDKVTGLLLGGYLAAFGVKILWQSCADLLDTSPGAEMINDLREHILAVPGAMAYHQFRTRRVGDLFEVDLHLQVDPQLTVEAGHDIARLVKKAILEKHPEVFEVLVHLEPASPAHLKDTGVHDRKMAAPPDPFPADFDLKDVSFYVGTMKKNEIKMDYLTGPDRSALEHTILTQPHSGDSDEEVMVVLRNYLAEVEYFESRASLASNRDELQKMRTAGTPEIGVPVVFRDGLDIAAVVYFHLTWKGNLYLDWLSLMPGYLGHPDRKELSGKVMAGILTLARNLGASLIFIEAKHGRPAGFYKKTLDLDREHDFILLKRTGKQPHGWEACG